MSFTIATALHGAHLELLSSSDTPLLDAEVLLADVLSVSRSYLFAFPERVLTEIEINSFMRNIEQRKQHVPIAYITGHKEFWSLDLIVTPDTLIPRPETELLVELVLQQVTGSKKRVADLGTGSGAVALALACERPTWEVHATDFSQAALEVAKRNAARLNISTIFFHQGSWFDALNQGKKFDVIVSNPPYIAPDDPYLQCENLCYEPQAALIADDIGLKDLRHIVIQAKQHLKPGGILLLEHGFDQAGEMRRIFENLGYSDIDTYQDLAGLDRVTGGRV